MKRKIAFGLLLCVVSISVLGGNVTKTASWSGPEPSGIVAIIK